MSDAYASNFGRMVAELGRSISEIPSRGSTLMSCIESKLRNSYDMYNEKLQEAFDYLLSRDNLKVIRTISRRK